MDDYEVIHSEHPYVASHVEDAVRRELNSIPGADMVLVQVAIKLAKQVDLGGNVAAASRELRMCMSALRDGQNVETVNDELDELQAKREARRKANG